MTTAQAADWVVVSADQADGDADQYGNISYWVEVSDAAGDTIRGLLKRSGKTPAPHPQEVIHARLEQLTSKAGNQYFRFFPERKGDYEATQTSGGTAGSSPGGQPGPVSRAAGEAPSQSHASPAPSGDERQRRIERQHSQEMALRALALMDSPVTPEDICVWTNWFVNDLEPSPATEQAGVEDSSSAPAPPSDDIPF